MFIALILVLFCSEACCKKSFGMIGLSGDLKFDVKIHDFGSRMKSEVGQRARELKRENEQESDSSSSQQTRLDREGEGKKKKRANDVIDTDEFGRDLPVKTWVEDVGSDDLDDDYGLDIEITSEAAHTPLQRRCRYKMPETKHANAMLSEMLNHLTSAYMKLEQASLRPGPVQRSKLNDGHLHRFQRTSLKRNTFFDNLFSNVSIEFKKNFNWTTNRVARTGLDPCTHQQQMKTVWTRLLDNAQVMYYSAALHCMDEFMRVQSRYDVSGARRVGRYLLRELDAIRGSLLDMLCERFRLCYHELL